MSEVTERLLKQFRDILAERLERLGRALMSLEAGPDVEVGKELLRELHGLKGEARMMGYAQVNDLTHQMEEVVRAAQEKSYALAAGSIDALLVACDLIAASAALPAGATVPGQDVGQILGWLKSRADSEAGKTPEKIPPLPPPLPSAPAPPPLPAPSAPDSKIRFTNAPREARAEGGIRISQTSLEKLTQLSTAQAQRNRRRELHSPRRLNLIRELHALARVAQDLGPVGQDLSQRLAKAKDVLSDLHRQNKLLFNEDLRDWADLSEEVTTLRMVPLAILFEAYPRMVRELARELGKEITLTVEGEDTQVDRTVLDGLKEPLLHLVRNAIDHGLETRPEREQAGKVGKGRLSLKAIREGERLLLAIEDDGCGLDTARLKQIAVARGILDFAASEQLGEEGARELIFKPGFSTKAAVTDLSGRGIGLDVVRVKLLAMGGEVTVASALGQGCRFELRVPISLTVAPLLFVEVGPQRLCLTATHVAAALKVEPGQVKELGGRPALHIDDALVPFAALSSVLGVTAERTAVAGELVLLVKGRGHVAALGVDRVLEERVQQVLPLKGMLARYEHLSGATAMGDGSLALVLSAAHLVATAQGKSLRVSMGGGEAAAAKRRKVLVVDDSPLTRELLASLLDAVGFEVTTAADGEEAFERLKKEPVELVVTDLEMPRLDGFGLTRRLKAHPTLSRLPVVIVTTRGSASDRQQGMEAGADAFITKGDLVRQDLVDVVSRLLG
jgi:two-component system sensor histidine kinase and response regulator WspE